MRPYVLRLDICDNVNHGRVSLCDMSFICIQDTVVVLPLWVVFFDMVLNIIILIGEQMVVPPYIQ